jgi:hypothetical protein
MFQNVIVSRRSENVLVWLIRTFSGHFPENNQISLIYEIYSVISAKFIVNFSLIHKFQSNLKLNTSQIYI